MLVSCMVNVERFGSIKRLGARVQSVRSEQMTVINLRSTGKWLPAYQVGTQRCGWIDGLVMVVTGIHTQTQHTSPTHWTTKRLNGLDTSHADYSSFHIYRADIDGCTNVCDYINIFHEFLKESKDECLHNSKPKCTSATNIQFIRRAVQSEVPHDSKQL